MADTNLFEELKDVLQDFKDFLDENISVIQPAVAALKAIIPDQINDLLSKLIDLINKLKAEIENLDVSTIPGLAEASEFTEKIKAFLEAAKNLLPESSDEINDVLSVADVVTSLPSLDEIKTEIIALLDAIIGHLNTLNS
jgi:ABC-type transporter Mla subunit MlaD